MKERLELIQQLKNYQAEFVMGFDSGYALRLLLDALEEEEQEEKEPA